ncbi:MAG: 50S ribosomal protein L18 [Clostridia bacterium]|nr:50S ribosomal protein L18 [Clostridia bacterium]
MIKKTASSVARVARHKRVRKNISGTAERPRLSVFRSNKHMYAQIIDDVNRVTLCAASTLEAGFEGEASGNAEAARQVGLMIAKKAEEKGIKNVVFDRGGFVYHGRVKELAEGAREGGLEF